MPPSGPSALAPPPGAYDPSARPSTLADSRARARRPGAAAAWLLAAVVCLGGVTAGAALRVPAGRPVLVAYLVAAPLAVAVVRRGIALRRVVLSLPLAFCLAVVVGAVLEAVQGGSPVTLRTVALTTAQVSVLHAPWLWGGTALGILVGLPRGLGRRARR